MDGKSGPSKPPSEPRAEPCFRHEIQALRDNPGEILGTLPMEWHLSKELRDLAGEVRAWLETSRRGQPIMPPWPFLPPLP